MVPRPASKLPVTLEQLPADVLAIVAGLVSKSEAASIALTCKLLHSKLPHSVQREIHGKRSLLRQAKRFLQHLPAINDLRNLVQRKNDVFSFSPPQLELLRLAFGPVGMRQTDLSSVMNQDLGGAEFALAGVLTYWAEVFFEQQGHQNGDVIKFCDTATTHAEVSLPKRHLSDRMLAPGYSLRRQRQNT